MPENEVPEQHLLLKGRFSFGLPQALIAALLGITIAAIVALSNLS